MRAEIGPNARSARQDGSVGSVLLAGGEDGVRAWGAGGECGRWRLIVRCRAVGARLSCGTLVARLGLRRGCRDPGEGGSVSGVRWVV